MYDAFKIGRADAVVLAPPFSVQLKREGFPILAHTAQYVTIPFSGLGTTIDRIKNNRAQIKKLLKAEIEALRFIQDNAAGTTEVIRKRFNMDEKPRANPTMSSSMPSAATAACRSTASTYFCRSKKTRS